MDSDSMTLHLQSIAKVPTETARVAKSAFPKGHILLMLRDEMGPIYTDQDFVDLYPAQGRPSLNPWRLVMICVMQFMEGLTDRQAADAVRSRIDWKYVLGLELTDPGWDFSVLTEFRQRLIKHQAEGRLLDLLLQRCVEKGWLNERGQQRTDSTHVLANIRTLHRLEGIGEKLRATLNELACVAPDWLQSWVPCEWYKRYANPVQEYHFPKGMTARQNHAELIGKDGIQLLETLWDDSTPAFLRKLPMVEILRQTWIYQYYIDKGQVRLRAATDQPAVSQRFDSPYDPDARFGNKGSTTWIGYKVHLTESCDDSQVHLITNVITTQAHGSDVEQTDCVHKALQSKGLLPKEHLVDSAYVDSDLLVTSQQHFGIDLVGPAKSNGSWQTKVPGAFDLTQFKINWNTRRVTCPQGKKSRTWKRAKDAKGNRVIVVRFSRTACRLCPQRSLCTRSPTEARSLTIRPQKRHIALQEARKHQQSQDWQNTYKRRAGIEGTLSQGINAYGLRRSRYLGLAKTHLQHVLTSTAINLVRIGSWLQGKPQAQTRISRFAALSPTQEAA
jgi:transposase